MVILVQRSRAAHRPHRRAGQLIRRLREDHGWTHDDMSAAIFDSLGARYATSPKTIWRAEAGYALHVRTRYAIATVLDHKPSDLWHTPTDVAA